MAGTPRNFGPPLLAVAEHKPALQRQARDAAAGRSRAMIAVTMAGLVGPRVVITFVAETGDGKERT